MELVKRYMEIVDTIEEVKESQKKTIEKIKNNDGIDDEEKIHIIASKTFFNDIIDKLDANLIDIEETVNGFIGRNLWVVEDIVEKDVVLNDGSELVYFDRLYSDDSICMRAVIVKGEDSNYRLFVVGIGESRRHENKTLLNISFRKNGRWIPCNVNLYIEQSNNLDSLIEFYMKKIKGLDRNTRLMRYLRFDIKIENDLHQKYIDLRNKYTFEDFKGIIAAKCPDCGKDALCNRTYEMFKDIEHKCHFCGSSLVACR